MYKKLLCLVLLLNVCNVWAADPEAYSSGSSSDSDLDAYSPKRKRLIKLQRSIDKSDQLLAQAYQKIVEMSEEKFQQLLADLRYTQENPEDEQELSSEEKKRDNKYFMDSIIEIRRGPVQEKFFRAIKKRNVEEVKQLLEKHPEAVHFEDTGVKKTRPIRLTPLLKITNRLTSIGEKIVEDPRDIEIARMLLEQGADVNARDHAGHTSLINAARLGQMNLVKFFLEHGANKFLEDSDGKTAVKKARSRSKNVFDADEKAKFEAIAKYIEDYDTGLTKSATASNLKSLKSE
jgi:hypothetical protein